MSLKIVILSDGLPCKVRQLGLFELDNVGREVLGVYKYTLLLATGQIVEDEYDIRALTYTPTAPDIPIEEINPNSPEHYQLKEFETYQCALAWEKQRIESYQGYCLDVTQYILEHCLNPEDRQRVITPEDWETVYQASLVPELTMEVLSQVLANVFQGFLRWASDPGRPFNYLKRRGQISSPALVGS